jgi:DNA-directed RNA polymerase specialized sigma24 family protein
MKDNRSAGLSRSAFEESVARAFPEIFNRLAARFNDTQLAEEVSVDSLAGAFEKWLEDPAYFQTRDLVGWSSRRAAWRALDRLRERTRHRPLPEERTADGGEPGWIPSIPSHYEEFHVDRLHDRELTWKCIQKLDPEDRAIITGYYYERLTDQELGASLFGGSASVQANGLKVWRRRQRACARLRVLLLASGIDPTDWSGAGGQAV